MKKLLVLTALMLVVATPVFAQGIGLGWENGISVKAMLDTVCLQGTFDFWSSSPEDDDADGTTWLDIAGYVAYPIKDMGESKLNVFGGVGIGTQTDRDMDLAIMGGLQHDVMVTDYISVTGKAGLEIYMDGGVRSGIDVVKAVALGARGVLIGRPWIYALAVRGEQGVVDLLDVFRREIATAMALIGVTRLEDITPELIEH